MKTIRTKAIVLRRTNYGEADRVIQLLTPNGKKSVIAKSVRREKSRLSGGIELFSICEVVIIDGKGELGILASARLVKFFRHIMEDYDRMQFAYQVIKLVTNASEMIDEPQWYDVLAEVLTALDTKINLQTIETWFYLHYSALMGYELSLFKDINGENISAEKKYHYDMSEKGLRPVENGNITSDHIKLLRLISSKPLKTIAQIGGTEKVILNCLLTTQEHASI